MQSSVGEERGREFFAISCLVTSDDPLNVECCLVTSFVPFHRLHSKKTQVVNAPFSEMALNFNGSCSSNLESRNKCQAHFGLTLPNSGHSHSSSLSI
mmetsp:Transcript_8201/g.24502  ORF Transcript_8201/g.24502 Transcript_8201/m.24502 type:complete len:97 (+) Transcript_8201:21-311(+)